MEESYEKEVLFPPQDYIRVNHEDLKKFVKKVFLKLGVPAKDAEITADNLVTADLRGISSHGVARLKRYVDGLRNGVVKAKPEIKIIRESPVHALVDGGFGLGQPVAYKAMKIAIDKAKKNFFGIVGVRNSNHYGIAGYYSLMALKEDLIGISMTNSRPLVAHTGALGRTIGTNPISFAAPSKEEPEFVLDMATSVVPIGKIEVYSRRGKPIPEGWAIDEEGNLLTDPSVALKAGTLLPLGGLGELLGGHKGYGLSVMVDILSGILTGANWGPFVGPTQGPEPSNVGHFFMAINVEAFMPLEEFKERMEELKRHLKTAKLHPKFKKIWIHGEKSWLTMRYRMKHGVPLYVKVVNSLREVSKEVGVELPF